jgi:hypothetical protein
MALPTIQDFLVDWPGWATLSPNYGDETSNTADGQIIVAELRPQFWDLDASTVTLSPTKLAHWKARLASLENGKRLFYGFDKTNYYPLAYPKGAWPTGGSFDGISAQINSMPDAYTLTLKLLPAGYTGKVGDFLQITDSDGNLRLHQVMEDFTANGSGITGSFAVEPYVRTGAAIGNVVAVKRPACTMMIVPGSVSYPSSSSAWGALSFKGRQVF